MSRRFAGLPAALSATNGDPRNHEEEIEIKPDGEGDEPEPKSKRKDKKMAEAEQNALVESARAEGRAEGRKEMQIRFGAVMASEHYAGREPAAAMLLTRESLASASASDLNDLLAAMPKVEQAALSEEQQSDAAEAGGRKEMQAVLATTNNSKIVTGGDEAKDDNAISKAAWDKAIARHS